MSNNFHTSKILYAYFRVKPTKQVDYDKACFVMTKPTVISATDNRIFNANSATLVPLSN